MFNPFVKFDKRMIDGFRKMNRRWLVSQMNVHATVPTEEESPIHILLTDYEDEGLARIHLSAVKDQYRAILCLDRKDHVAKLEEMASLGRYILWAAFIPGSRQIQQRLHARFTRNMENYIKQNTNWRIGANQTIHPKLELIFGELFVSLKYRSQHIRIRLEELEKY